MKCINCNREIGDNKKFCNYCGTMQPIDKEARLGEHHELAGTLSNGHSQQPWNMDNASPQPSATATTVTPPSQPSALSQATPPSPGNELTSSPGGTPTQCPDCGNIIPANSSSCPYCGCLFATPGQQGNRVPAGLTTELVPTREDATLNRRDRQGGNRQNKRKAGMAGWAKALLTLSIVMLVGAIGGGLYYFLIYNRVGKFTLDEDEVTFSRNGGTKTVAFSTDATEIEVVKKPQWVTVEVGSDDITIKCQQLDIYGDRDGVIKLKAGNKEAKITVKQNSKATYMRLSQDFIKTGHNSEEVVINLDTDGDPSSIDFDIDDHYMCSLTDKSSTGFTVIIEENSASSPRQCSITISSGTQSKTLTIIQAGQCMWCDGSGHTSCSAFNCNNGRIECSSCGGDGEIYDGYNYDLGESIYTQCDDCGGRGYNSCERCGGRGYNSCDHCNGTGNNFTREE